MYYFIETREKEVIEAARWHCFHMSADALWTFSLGHNAQEDGSASTI